jgi:molybdenum cofactor cytidylyltransferase
VAALNSQPVQVVFNPEWEQGIAASIRCGLEALLNRTPTPDQVIFMVCDQPFVTAELLLELVNERQNTHKPIVASAYGGTLGIPALFEKSLFPQLLDLQGDTGAKHLIMEHPEKVAAVNFPEGNIDVDTEGEYEQLIKKVD